jgi:hypothetical protein
MIAAACLVSPGMLRATEICATQAASTLHAVCPSTAGEPDFLDHLQRRLDLDRETALATLGEALLRYEPSKPRRA